MAVSPVLMRHQTNFRMIGEVPSFWCTIAILLLILTVTCSSQSSTLLAEASFFDCSSQSTCDSCYGYSYLCHWCAGNATTPGSCHAKLSTQGCQVGTSCSGDDCSDRHTCSSCEMGGCKWCGSECVALYSWQCALPRQCFPNAQCVRKEPEYIGYDSAPSGVAFTAFAIVLILSSVAACNVLVCWRLKSLVSGLNNPPQRIPRERLLVHGTLVEDEDSPLGRSSANSTTSTALIPLFDALFASLFACTAWLWGLAVFGAICTAFFATLFYPHPPVVNVCNAQVMWEKLLSMLVRSAVIHTSVDLEILVSVYNPNRLSVKVRELSGDVFYRGIIPVASLTLGELNGKGGYVTDSLGTLTFTGLNQAADMLYDFNYLHKLELSAKIATAFDVMWGDRVLMSLSTVLPEIAINANEPPKQGYCHCKESSPWEDHILASTEFDA